MTFRKRKVWIAVGFWLFFLIMFFNMTNYFQPFKYALIGSVYNLSTLMVMYYLTVWYLFPKFYNRGKTYFFISFAFVVVLGILFCLIDIHLLPVYEEINHERPPVQFHYAKFILGLAFTFFVGTSLSLMEQANKMKENEKLLTEEKLETELKLLKAQINPHFIFNALNNIYSLSYMKSQNAPDSVLKLSEMLRYVFYDCSKDRVPLSAELKYIENYNAFQQMKSDYTQNISLLIDTDTENTEIAPMLFIPFLENAYKYSRIEENEDAFVSINIRSKDSNLHFKIENSIPQKARSAPGSGMGIKNVKHRLAIIYPGKHALNIEEENDLYTVVLTLEV